MAGCSSGGSRHIARAPQPQRSYAFDGVVLEHRPRGGQLGASREWERMGAQRPAALADDAKLRAGFVRDLSTHLPLDPMAALHVRVELKLQDTAYYEGLAAETSDVTLYAELSDATGAIFRVITLREAASAPLQRSASRRQRLEPAFARLAQRLARLL